MLRAATRPPRGNQPLTVLNEHLRRPLRGGKKATKPSPVSSSVHFITANTRARSRQVVRFEGPKYAQHGTTKEASNRHNCMWLQLCAEQSRARHIAID